MKLLVEKIKLNNQFSILDAMIDIFCLLYHDISKELIMLELNKKIQEAKDVITKIKNDDIKLKKLIYFFYSYWKFKSVDGIYNVSNALRIDYVLREKKGIALSLGIILIDIAKKLDINLYPIIFPTQFIVSFNDKNNKEIILINPVNGEFLNKETLDLWLKGSVSPTTTLKEEDLKYSENIVVLHKILHNLKLALIEEKNMILALKISNFLIQIKENDPYEIRDRGLIYAHLECNRIAISDLTYFIEKCPDDPVAEIIRMQIHLIKKKSIVLH
ncbi:UPF0162 protein YchA [Buchnera aphidicola (Thelaxes suberi)]|uniref:transglutaminase family protein n=1 Tax=Buchnera aphidicola TaxID=9 RepID=UPI0034644070